MFSLTFIPLLLIPLLKLCNEWLCGWRVKNWGNRVPFPADVYPVFCSTRFPAVRARCSVQPSPGWRADAGVPHLQLPPGRGTAPQRNPAFGREIATRQRLTGSQRHIIAPHAREGSVMGFLLESTNLPTSAQYKSTNIQPADQVIENV